MSLSYFIPNINLTNIHRREMTVRQSRFIISIAHTPTVETAKNFIEKLKYEFSNASHHCWAFIAGAPEKTIYTGYSDAGEPHGTAGRPMMNILIHKKIGEITAIITRYFGGIKLGKGGLMRAYQQTIQLGLEELPLKKMAISTTLEVVLSYEHISSFLHLLQQFHCIIINELFTSDVTYVISIQNEYIQSFQNELTNLTSGTVLITQLLGKDIIDYSHS